MFKLGAIGAGHMGMTVLDGVISHGLITADNILVYEINPERKRKAKERDFIIAGSENEVYANAELLLLAVSPQDCEELLARLARCSQRQCKTIPVIISIMAGISSNFIREYLGTKTAIINVMPTMGMKVNQGATALAHTDNVPESALSLLLQIFAHTGEAIVVKEEHLKEIVAVGGCMPGYVFYMIDAFAKAAESRGIEYRLAIRMAARGFMGAATQVLEAGANPKDMISQVCTPGGLTEEGIRTFDNCKLDEHLKEGLVNSILRGYNLAK